MQKPNQPVRTAVDKAYEVVLEKILSGEYPAGKHLIESEVATAVGVSRTPVREALKRLSAESYVLFRPNRGVYVAERKLQEEAYDAIGLRGVIEAYGIELATSRITNVELAELELIDRRINEAVRQNTPPRNEAAVALSLEFHMLVARATRCETLVGMLRLLLDRPLVAGLMVHFDEDGWEASRHARSGVLEALRAVDGKRGAALITSFVLQSRKYIRSSMDANTKNNAEPITGDILSHS